jgi:cephalosporin hydroxylase
MKSKYTCVNEADSNFSLIQHISEIDTLVDFIISQPPLEDFIEIGTHQGGTFYVLASLIGGMKISIDYCEGGFGGVGDNQSKERNGKLMAKFEGTHFIEGDSHKYETVEKLKYLLGNKKVSLLFIDGDHTEEGCLKDLMIYLQFVKQEGYIVFHDIKDTKFHQEQGCYVNKVWYKITEFIDEADGYAHEIVTGNGEDCSISAASANNVEWGGIGLIQKGIFNYLKHVQIFQGFHDQESLDMCFDTLESKDIKYLPELIINTEKVFFESNIIKTVYDNYEFEYSQYVGITSPRLHEKTGLTVKKLIDIVTESKKAVVIYSPDYSSIGLKGVDVWQENKAHNPDIYKAAKFLNDKKILPFDIFKKKWHECYCNYWIVTNHIFQEYCKEVLTPAMNEMKYSSEYHEFAKDMKLNHRGKDYPISVFVLELLFGTTIANNNYLVKEIFNEE